MLQDAQQRMLASKRVRTNVCQIEGDRRNRTINQQAHARAEHLQCTILHLLIAINCVRIMVACSEGDLILN